MAILSTIALYAVRLLLAYGSLSFLAAAVSVQQERKIWAAGSLPPLTVFGMLKVYVFNVVWMLSCLVWAVLLWPKALLTGSAEYEAHYWGERTVGIMCCGLIGPEEVRGEENLPADNATTTPAPVYVANHASQIDVAVVYFLRRRFRWTAKKSVIYLPGVGQLMYLGKHVFIDRKKKKGGKTGSSGKSNVYELSKNAVQTGTPMFFFPQGTRWMATQKPFKDGAFNVAIQNKSSLIPVSIDIPSGVWNYGYPLWGPTPPPVVLTVHKPIVVDGTEDKAKLKEQCVDAIYSVLPKVPVEEVEEKDSKKTK